jgi:hypothetical protein
MPVDRELAYESIKQADPELYGIYARLKHSGLKAEEVREHIDSFYKLIQFELFNVALDYLEASGFIEIKNDYENKQVMYRRNRVQNW